MHACISNLLGTQSGYIIKITFEISPLDLCEFFPDLVFFLNGNVRLLSIPDLFCVFTFFPAHEINNSRSITTEKSNVTTSP